ncbi:MAG: hypothetical protein SPJ55_11705 [Treponema sp.]|nr:hypothetical protein [Treponema sp.]
MPGLSQLKKFSQNLLSIGDEVIIRSSRGEKPVRVKIPKDIVDTDDSEEFMLGMPEIASEVESEVIDDDLSDLMGLSKPASDKNDESESVPSFEAPDMSSILNPVIMDGDGSDVQMPDLSMFEDSPAEEIEEEEIEAEPEEISIADMGLDALLAGSGFDGSEGKAESESNSDDYDDFYNFDDSNDSDDSAKTDNDAFIPDDFLHENVNASDEIDNIEELEELDNDKFFGAAEDNTPLDKNPETGGESEAAFGGDGDIEDLGELGETGDSGASGDADVSALDELGDIGDFDIPGDTSGLDGEQAAGGDSGVADLGVADLGELGELGDSGASGDAGDFGDIPDIDDFGAAEDNTPLDKNDEPGGESEAAFGGDGDIADLGELGELEDSGASGDADVSALDKLGDIGDFDIPGDTSGLDGEQAADVDSGVADLGDADVNALDELGDIGDFDIPGDTSGLDGEQAAGVDSGVADLGDAGDFGDLSASGDAGDFGDIPDFDDFGAAEDNTPLDKNLEPGDESEAAFDGDGDIEDLGELGESEDSGASGDADVNVLEELGDLGDFDIPGDTSGLDGEQSAGVDSGVADLGDAGDFGDLSASGDADVSALDELGDLGDFDIPGDTSGLDGEQAAGGDTGVADLGDAGDFGDIPDFDDISSQNDFSVTDEIPDYNDSIFDNDESLDDSDGNKSTEDDISLEDFDTSAMDDMDFGIADTDSKLNGGFEMGSNDDFLMEGEFEIPGFSDVSTVKEEKHTPLVAKKDSKKSKKGISEVDFSEAEESEELPPNTLSDAQYKQFLKNLSEYPLNVRLAFENLIVQDEFTDDAEFEIIEKILNKAPARQVASFLEKMLDTSIPVPRDFEHRTAEEYEAYKKSLSYQLRNRIIPACLIGITLMLAFLGIYHFSKNCIYKPLKAHSLYKQGYALLQADEYPQSEMKFEEACKYRISKKWFFNYARGYRNHKQYQRASAMYDRILSFFKHDKAAGLEYADMELNDMANYERAEEIVRREVLDYHINDPDGILKLGDIFLEWGTEKDPEKLELAREQYANLLQLYGKNQRSSDLYLSRMMRYFIRTDNLKQVIPLKKVFEPREKSLCADDWAELSGYLLDKYYGTLAPSEEYLRYEIDGLRGLLLRAVKTNPDNPIAYYNLAKYFIKSGENAAIENTLQTAIEKFNTVPSMKKRDIYKYIDSYRLLGEQYIDMENYLQAQEQFSEGISLFTTERDNAGFEGNADIGKLYEDMGNIKYSISGDYDDALTNYKYSVELGNDTPNLRYRIGYIQYKKNNYGEALGSFMKAGDGNVKERNLMLAMANTLFLRGDDYAAQGYYSQLIDSLDREIEKRGIVFPQTSVKDYDVVNTYLYASNNYGVTLYNLAKRTGNSALNAQAIVQFSQSLRAWDALTRNQETLVRLEGSNLAQQNIQYITHQVPEFEPSIYTDISKTLLDNEKL